MDLRKDTKKKLMTLGIRCGMCNKVVMKTGIRKHLAQKHPLFNEVLTEAYHRAITEADIGLLSREE